MDLAKIEEVELRYRAASAAVDAAAADLAPLAAAHARGQQALYAAQRALEPITQEREYLAQQFQIERASRDSRQALLHARALYEAPPPSGAPNLSGPLEQAWRSLGEDALRDACAHVWLDRESTTQFGLGADYVTVSTDDPAALKALQEHVRATGGYHSLLKLFARPRVVRD